jgi:hypothetical protein
MNVICIPNYLWRERWRMSEMTSNRCFKPTHALKAHRIIKIEARQTILCTAAAARATFFRIAIERSALWTRYIFRICAVMHS